MQRIIYSHKLTAICNAMLGKTNKEKGERGDKAEAHSLLIKNSMNFN